MRVAIVGTGYVGLVTGACLADTGVTVTCVDINEDKIASLRQGKVPIFEPGLGEVVERTTAQGRLRFSSSLLEAVNGYDGNEPVDAVFIAVGTPPGEDGAADLRQVRGVAREIGFAIRQYTLILTKSTVPVGTGKLVRQEVLGAMQERREHIEFDVASNPEFLKEGAAVADFMRPDRIVVGVDSDRAKGVVEKIYRPFILSGQPVIFMDIASAEITKYAANAMLATRISFMNSIALLCDHVGADVSLVRRGIGTDPRIGSQFLYAGAGYGGSCFPKDVRALAKSAAGFGIPMPILDAVEAVNEAQKLVPVSKLRNALGIGPDDRLDGLRISIWGFAFKPNTDDVREAPAIEIIRCLVLAGAEVALYDPVALPQVNDSLSPEVRSGITIAPHAMAALDGADALILVTEWAEFRTPDPTEMARRMRGRVVIDARNVLDFSEFRKAGFEIRGIGRSV
jgi:UDPglucose 6-dehydrogenase